MKGLATVQKNKRSLHNNRSSTVFPFFPGKSTINYIVFQNYWAWKRHEMHPENIICIIRGYDSKGDLVAPPREHRIKEHNCINLNEDYGIENENLNLKTSSIEVEFISSQNISFPFPAIMLFCVDNNSGEVSCVHSGGRRLNSNEKKSVKKYTETNWLSIENQKFTPFFHVFNDSIQTSEINQKIDIKVILAEERDKAYTHSISHTTEPFGSKLYYLSNILPHNITKNIKNKEFWIEIALVSSAFPRMIVGNYDKEADFHYITHSFGKIEIPDYIQPESPAKITSFFHLPNVEPLCLQARCFPTNLPGTINAQVIEFANNTETSKTLDSISFNGCGDRPFISSNSSTSLKLYKVFGKCPSRINMSCNYSLPNSRHPTDIASGFKSIDNLHFKKSHWGQGICNKSFQTIILIANTPYEKNSPLGSSSANNIIKIDVFDDNNLWTKDIFIPRSGWTYFKVTSDEFPELKDNFFSWRFKDTTGTHNIDTSWVSFSIASGSLCGDHGF